MTTFNFGTLENLLDTQRLVEVNIDPGVTTLDPVWFNETNDRWETSNASTEIPSGIYEGNNVVVLKGRLTASGLIAGETYYLNDSLQVRSDGSLFQDYLTDLTPWTDGDAGTGASTQAVFQGRDVLKLVSGATGADIAERRIAVGGITTTEVIKNVVLETLVFRTSNTLVANDHDSPILQFYTGDLLHQFTLAGDDIGVYDDSVWTALSTNGVPDSKWTHLVFDIKTNGLVSTVDVYIDGIKVVTGASAGTTSSSTPGQLSLAQDGNITFNHTTYFDFVRVGTKLIQVGGITTEETDIKLGIAVSDTEFLVNIEGQVFGGLQKDLSAGYILAGSDNASPTVNKYNSVEKLTFITEAVSAVSSVLPTARTLIDVHKSSSAGYQTKGSGELTPANESQVYKLLFSNDDITTVTSASAVGHGSSNFNSTTSGYASGSQDAPTSSNIDRLQFSNESSAEISSKKAVDQYNSGSFNTVENAYTFCGSSSSTTIDKFAFVNEAVATVLSNVSDPASSAEGMSSLVSGYITTGGSSLTYLNKLEFSNDNLSVVVSTLSVKTVHGAGVETKSDGYIMSGWDTSGGSNSDIQKLNFTTEITDITVDTISLPRVNACGIGSR